MNNGTTNPVQTQANSIDQQGLQNPSANSDQACIVQPLNRPLLAITIDGQNLSIDPVETFAGGAEKLLQACNSSKVPVEIELSSITEYQPLMRLQIFDFITQVSSKNLCINNVRYDNVLDAILSLYKPDSPINDMSRLKLALLEAAVILHPLDLPEACQKIMAKLRDKGQKGLRHGDLLREAKKIQAQLELPQESRKQLRVKEVIADAPVGEESVIPEQWTLDSNGISKTYGKHCGKFPALVFVTAISVDDAGKQAVVLTWKSGKGWHSRVVDRQDISDSHRCTSLSRYGIPVTSNTAPLLVQYFADFITTNEHALPVIATSSRMGFYQLGDDHVFLLGNKVITAGGVLDQGENLSKHSVLATRVMFRGHDDGQSQLAEGFRTSGSLEVWQSTINKLLSYPKLHFMLMASFAPVMLEITRCASFTISIAGRTSVGKTATLKFSASVWGCPEDGDHTSIIFNWDATATYRERLRLTQNNLPIFIDETKLAKGYEQEVAKNIYAVSSGRSRGRGTLAGVARQESSRTISFLTGEQAATSFSQDGGAAARVLEFWGSPFGDSNSTTGTLVRESVSLITQHYGHAGPLFVQYVLQHKAEWPQWREQYLHLVADLETKAGGNAVLLRCAAYLATIVLTSQLVHKALQMPGDWINPIEPLWQELSEGSQQADLPKKALLVAYEHAIKHLDRFQHGDETVQNRWYGTPHEVLGRWEQNHSSHSGLQPVTPPSEIDFDWIGYIPGVLTKLLKDAGFDPDAMIRQWKDAGWLETDQDKNTKRNQKSTRINRTIVRVYAIKGSAIASLMAQ